MCGKREAATDPRRVATVKAVLDAGVADLEAGDETGKAAFINMGMGDWGNRRA